MNCLCRDLNRIYSNTGKETPLNEGYVEALYYFLIQSSYELIFFLQNASRNDPDGSLLIWRAGGGGFGMAGIS